MIHRHSILPVLLAVAAGLVTLFLAYALWVYGALETYLDHAEPGVAVNSWRFAQGGQLFLAAESEDFVITAYGPLIYMINGAVMALLGGSITASKLSGLLAALLGLSVFAFYVARRHGGSRVPLGVLLYACFLLIPAPISFWTRPDPLLVLLLTLALCVTLIEGETGWRRWAAPVMIAVLAGLAMNLKIHAPVYFLPLVFRYCVQRWVVTWTVMAVLGALAALLPFALDQVSLANYLSGLAIVAGSRSVQMVLLASGLKWGLLFVLPSVLALAVLVGRGGRAERGDLLYGSVILFGLAVALYPSSIQGGGWYHLLPFFPLTLDLFIRLLRRLPAKGWEGAVLQSVFALAFVIVSVTPQKRLHRNFANLAWARAASNEIGEIMARHPSKRIEMGYGEDVAETYKLSYLRPLLAFAGHPTSVTATMAMEMRFSSTATPEAKIRYLERCATDLWLVPKGEAPFRLSNYFNAEPAFWPPYVAAFDARYVKTGHLGAWDLWECRKGGRKGG